MRPVFFFALLMIPGLACGPADLDLGVQPVSGQEHDIINGEVCGRDRMETAVAILIDAEIEFFGTRSRIRQPMCTGTLIAPDTVLAAAHCFQTDLLTMGMGTVLSEQFGMTFEPDLTALAEDQQGTTPWPDDHIDAVLWLPHPEFDIDSMNNVTGPGEFKDVGIMFLAEAVPGIRPEVLITANEASQIAQNTSVEIAGWGQQTVTSGWETPPPGTVGAKRCATSFINEVGIAEMQIGGDSSSSRKCHGDSGGPTYMEVSTSHDVKRRLVGITSHAYDDSDCQKGGVDTRVDTWLGWIDERMRAACQDGTRAWCDEPGILLPSRYDVVRPDAGSGGGDDDDAGTSGQHFIEGCPCHATTPPSAGISALWGLTLLALVWRRWGRP
ncbi:MAG: trypsin-like serine protease [Pseudomonadota bacterium]